MVEFFLVVERCLEEDLGEDFDGSFGNGKGLLYVAIEGPIGVHSHCSKMLKVPS